MRLPRIYIVKSLEKNTVCELTGDTAHHVMNVLRMRKGQELLLFNNQGDQFMAEIISTAKKCVEVKVDENYPSIPESELKITLVQGISRGHRMDYTIQKSVELGVTRIIPVISEFCTVQLNSERRQKKYNHWKGI